MGNDMTTDEYEHRGFFRRIVDTLSPGDDLEEEYQEEPQVGGKRRPVSLRLQSTGVSYVAVRQPQSIDDARIAADGLKDGRQQIINLEKTSQDVSERIIDFLSGVTYALNGFVEKVGERVYVFAPSNVAIDVPDDLRRAALGLTDRGF